MRCAVTMERLGMSHAVSGRCFKDEWPQFAPGWNVNFGTCLGVFFGGGLDFWDFRQDVQPPKVAANPNGSSLLSVAEIA